MSTLNIDVGDLRARSAEVTDSELVVTFIDGRRVTTPLAWYPRLLGGTPEQRAKYEIMPMGIHWPELDEDLSVAGMLQGHRERSDVVKELLRLAKEVPLTAEFYERQRRSFVFGNTALDNKNITREIIDAEADRLSRDVHDKIG
jgi:Protein of unknown function (DUF2442)